MAESGVKHQKSNQVNHIHKGRQMRNVISIRLSCIYIIYYLIFNWWLIPSPFVNRTNIMQSKLCVSHIIYIIHTVQGYSVLYIKAVRLYMWVGILLTCGHKC